MVDEKANRDWVYVLSCRLRGRETKRSSSRYSAAGDHGSRQGWQDARLQVMNSKALVLDIQLTYLLQYCTADCTCRRGRQGHTAPYRIVTRITSIQDNCLLSAGAVLGGLLGTWAHTVGGWRGRAKETLRQGAALRPLGSLAAAKFLAVSPGAWVTHPRLKLSGQPQLVLNSTSSTLPHPLFS